MGIPGVTSSDGHMGGLVGKRYREIVVFNGILLIYKIAEVRKMYFGKLRIKISCIKTLQILS